MQSARRANIIALVLVAAWTFLGFYFHGHPESLSWLPRVALSLAVLGPVAWVVIYTLQGVLGHGKWWRTDVGTNLVWMQLAVLASDGMVCFAQFTSGGAITSFTEAWIYIGGVVASFAIITWRSVIWLRNYRLDPNAELRNLRVEVARLRALLAERGLGEDDGAGEVSVP